MTKQTETELKALTETKVFAPSWVDRLMIWIDRLPFPFWLFYVILALAVALTGHIVRWIDGSIPVGSLQLAPLASAPPSVAFLALIHYLNTTARKALATFRPLLEVEEQEYTRIEYVLTTIPRRPGIVAFLVGAFLGVASVHSGPASWGLSENPSVPTTAFTLLFAMTLQCGVVLWMVHTIQQLRTVDRIHRMVTKVNLFHLEPAYAFSGLTLRTAMGLLSIAYYYLFLSYLGVFGAPTAINAVAVGASMAIALAAFVLPLSWMHRRLAEEKSKLVAEANSRYSSIVERFNRQIDHAELEQLDTTSRAIATLASQRDALAKISTWPWRPDALRSLLSTFALPILLYLGSRLLGRFLGV